MGQRTWEEWDDAYNEAMAEAESEDDPVAKDAALMLAHSALINLIDEIDRMRTELAPGS